MLNGQKYFNSLKNGSHPSDRDQLREFNHGKHNVTKNHKASRDVTEHHAESQKKRKFAPDTENRIQITDTECRPTDFRETTDKENRASAEKREREREKQTLKKPEAADLALVTFEHFCAKQSEQNLVCVHISSRDVRPSALQSTQSPFFHRFESNPPAYAQAAFMCVGGWR